MQQFAAYLQGYLQTEHKDSGAHANVTADSVTVSSNTETGATGQISANGGTHTLGEFVFRSGSNFINEMVEVGGATTGWKFGRRNLSGLFSVTAQGFALFDLSKDTSSPVFDIGYYSFGDYFVLNPGIPGGKAFALGNKDGTSSDRIKYLAVQDGMYEQGRSVAAGYGLDYTPTWSTGGTLGNGTLAGRYDRIGNRVNYAIRLDVGSTTTFSGAAFLFTLPVTKRNDNYQVIDNGMWLANDTSAGVNYVGWTLTNTTQVEPALNLGANQAVSSPFNTTVPFTWATGDVLVIRGTYEAA